MVDPFLGFGLAAMGGAVVGGGFKAFGITIPVISSYRRQVMLGVLGLCVISAREWDYIYPVLYPLRFQVVELAPALIHPGETHNFVTEIEREGLVEVTVKSIISQPTPGSVSSATPELRFDLCASTSRTNCASEQTGINGTLGQFMPVEKATIYVFNYEKNPAITFQLTINKPRRATLLGL